MINDSLTGSCGVAPLHSKVPKRVTSEETKAKQRAKALAFWKGRRPAGSANPVLSPEGTACDPEAVPESPALGSPLEPNRQADDITSEREHVGQSPKVSKDAPDKPCEPTQDEDELDDVQIVARLELLAVTVRNATAHAKEARLTSITARSTVKQIVQENKPLLIVAKKRFSQPGQKVPVDGRPTWGKWVKRTFNVTDRYMRYLMGEPKPPKKGKTRLQSEHEHLANAGIKLARSVATALHEGHTSNATINLAKELLEAACDEDALTLLEGAAATVRPGRIDDLLGKICEETAIVFKPWLSEPATALCEQLGIYFQHTVNRLKANAEIEVKVIPHSPKPDDKAKTNAA